MRGALRVSTARRQGAPLPCRLTDLLIPEELRYCSIDGVGPFVLACSIYAGVNRGPERVAALPGLTAEAPVVSVLGEALVLTQDGSGALCGRSEKASSAAGTVP